MKSQPFEIAAIPVSGKKKAHKHKLFCPVGLGTAPGLSRGFHPGTNSVKIWETPGFSPYVAQCKPGKPGLVPGTNPGLSLGQTRGRRAAQKAYVNKVYVCTFDLPPKFQQI